MVPARPGMAFVEYVFPLRRSHACSIVTTCAYLVIASHTLNRALLQWRYCYVHLPSYAPFFHPRYDDEIHASAALQGLQVRLQTLFQFLFSKCTQPLFPGISHH